MGQLILDGIDRWKYITDAGSLTDENVHDGSANIVRSHQLGRSIRQMRIQDVRAWFCAMGYLKVVT